MKSILIGLTLTLWIQSFPGYTQTDSSYCLPISKARLLVADALRLKVSEELNGVLASRVDLLQSQQIADHNSYSNLLKISDQKYLTQKQSTGDMERLAYSFRDQMNSAQKASRKHRRQRNLLGLGLLVVVSLVIIK